MENLKKVTLITNPDRKALKKPPPYHEFQRLNKKIRYQSL
jgi:hypothetical protein